MERRRMGTFESTAQTPLSVTALLSTASEWSLGVATREWTATAVPVERQRRAASVSTVELLMSSTRRLGQCGKKEASPASVMLVCLLLMGREAPTQPAASGGSRSAARAARALRRSWRECSWR